MNAAPHLSVMVDDVVEMLAPVDGGIYVDATFGAGGYTSSILAAADCTVFAIDRDPSAKAFAAAVAEKFPGRLTLLAGCFGDMVMLLGEAGVTRVNGIAFDLGVSSMQLDQAERGFSFRTDGPLDMRMGDSGQTAADLVNTMEENDLANIIYDFGEERLSRRIAKAIVARRSEQRYERTLDLAKTVRSVVRKSADGIDPATRTFQAIRIAVNDELGEIRRGLEAAEQVLVPGGRVCVVAFHSLEDRMVKRFFRARSGGEGASRHGPPVTNKMAETLRLVERRARKPRADETAINPRARSARMRTAERLETDVIGGGS